MSSLDPDADNVSWPNSLHFVLLSSFVYELRGYSALGHPLYVVFENNNFVILFGDAIGTLIKLLIFYMKCTVRCLISNSESESATFW